jgi:uncharacterized damage-inducible protein DinB
MTYYGGRNLAASFRQVRANTIQVAQDIPEQHYGFKAAPGARSIAQLLTHVAFGPGFQLLVHTTGITDLKQVNFSELGQKGAAEEAKTRTKAELVALLKAEGERFATFVEGLSDEFLGELVAMPPGASPAHKSRFEMLLSPKEHEMHHHGQLMLLQRMVGVVPHLTRQMQERMAARAAATAAAGPSR